MDDKEIQKRVKAGEILIQVSFEVVGNPKEHVEKTIVSFVDNIKKDQAITVLSEEYGEAEEIQNSQGLWGTYVDCEMLVGSLDKLTWLCINFMPASIEIIAPEEIRLKEKDMTNWLNDLLAKLHEISTTIRQSNITDELMIKNMNALIQNACIVAAEKYHKPEDIGNRVGIDAKTLQPFFDVLVKNNKLEKKGEDYYLKGHAETRIETGSDVKQITGKAGKAATGKAVKVKAQKGGKGKKHGAKKRS